MAALNFVPLVLALLVGAVTLLTPLSVWADRVVTRVALAVAGSAVTEGDSRRERRQSTLRAAFFPTTYREYAAKTRLYAVVSALVVGVTTTYLVWATVELLAVSPSVAFDVLPEPLWFLTNFWLVDVAPLPFLLPLLGVTTLTVGVVAGLAVHQFRWWYPKNRAGTRARLIEVTLPQTVAFLYALSRSGMEFPKVMRILSENRAIYGEPAREVETAVKNMEMVNVDMLTAIKAMARRTPSEDFKEFGENLASVLQSGRNFSSFLRSQYEAFQDEAEAQQEQLLDLVATLAEAYVTVFVAGPLFLITILVIVGLAVGDTLDVIRLLIYAVIPLGTVVFISYLDTMTGNLQRDTVTDVETPDDAIRDVRRAPSTTPRADGGVETDRSVLDVASVTDATRRANVERLSAYRRLRWFQARLGSPVQTVVERPTRLLYLTIPLAVLLTMLRIPQATGGGPLTLAALDDLVVQATLFVVGSFAVVYEVHRRRIESIERTIPDFLDRMASVNEAGMTVVESIDRVRGSEMGALDDELDRIWADIQWGADIERALKRFEARMRTRTVSRMVTLLTNAMSASGDLATVLRIAADQAKSDQRLKRERKQEMLTYTVVVYVSFFVFMVIIAAVAYVLIPNLPTEDIVGDLTEDIGTFGAVDAVSNIGSVDVAAYKLAFFHATLIQGLLSGFVAGKMSAGSVKDGAKHATILLALGYVGFIGMSTILG